MWLIILKIWLANPSLSTHSFLPAILAMQSLLELALFVSKD
jgi:hypothetical protein